MAEPTSQSSTEVAPPPSAAPAPGQPDPRPTDPDAPINLFNPPTVPSATTASTAPAHPVTDLAFLRDNPQFQQIRAAVQQHPELLPSVLANMGQANPALLQLINANPEQFMELLSEGAEDDGGDDTGMAVVQVTQTEQDAINRLLELGFPRNLVIQAYFACDKNEEMAANWLFEYGHEDD